MVSTGIVSSLLFAFVISLNEFVMALFLTDRDTQTLPVLMWLSLRSAGTPRLVVDKLNGILVAYVKLPEVQDKLNALAITPITSTPDELEKFIPAEIEKWSKVVKDAGIEPQ